MKNIISKMLRLDKYIDVGGADFRDFASVNTYALNKTQAQVWVLEKCGDDVYHIRSNGDTNLTLDVLNWDTTNGNSLQLYHYNEGIVESLLSKRMKMEPIALCRSMHKINA